MYDPSGDSTIPSTSKKRKFEEVEEEEEEGEEPAPVVKTKKPKKEPVTEGGLNGSDLNLWAHGGVYDAKGVFSACFTEEAETSAAAEETPKKKKKKKKEKAEAEAAEAMEEVEEVAVTEVSLKSEEHSYEI